MASRSPVEVEFLDQAAKIDVENPAPHGRLCDACGAPVESWDKFCTSCGAPQDAAGADAPGSAIAGSANTIEPIRRFFRCEKCGAEVATDPNQRSYACPFCDSTYVVEYSPAATGRQRPEFVIGFALTQVEAEEKYRQWIAAGGWFHPGDLRHTAAVEKMRGVYLPFWSFSMLAESRWSASIGEYWYRTETYTVTENGKTVTKTRTVQETEWWPLSGRHHRYYNGYLVSGSRGLPQVEAERIKPFQLPALARYEPKYLAGWLAEEYSIDRDEAQRLCQAEFHRQEERNIGAFLPGDTHRSLQVETWFKHVNSDLCLLPIFIFSYRYQDKVYRFLVNGQTGRTAGDKPLSWRRITAFVLAIVLLIAIIALVVMAVGSR
jgi:DNA-directed RNA polymerase subunit RPC12/RpoP